MALFEKSLPPGSPQRLLAISAVFLILLLAAVTVVFLPESNNGRVEPSRAVKGAIDAFNDKEFSDAASYFSEDTEVTINGREETMNRAAISERMASTMQRFAYLNIRPRNFQTEYFDEKKNSARVIFQFHWTAASTLYPNARNTSERSNPGGEPEVVALNLAYGNDSWIINQVEFTYN